MSDHKRTRRACEGERTLHEHIADGRERLVARRKEVPQLRRRAEELRQAAEAMRDRYQVRRRRDVLCEAARIDAECDEREGMRREHDFERKVVTYLKTYHSVAMAQPSDDNEGFSKKQESIEAYIRYTDKSRAHQGHIVDEYLTAMKKAAPKVAMAVRDTCPRCENEVKLLHRVQKSMLTCPECGYSVVYLDSSSTSTSFDEMVEFSQYSYKRVNHYLMWIALVQGKEAHRVSDDILETVMADLYKQGVRDCAEITNRKVRESLRRLRLRKAYDHVTQIASRLSGIRPKQLSPQVEERLKNMFLQMQPAFHRHAPKTRSNFLSYSYVLYRCFQILGLHDMLDTLVLLKGRDKLEANDAIFRKMCEVDLGWPTFDLPPASETVP